MIKIRISRKPVIIMMLIMVLATVMIGSMFIPENAYGEEWHEIWNRTQLENIKNDLNANYRLMADINLGGDVWTPIGLPGSPFNGKLDGNSRIISNFTITDTTADGKGLFAAVGASAQIYNLGVEGADITAGSYAGILTGFNLGSISRCYAKGSISGEYYVGGLVGINQGQLTNCYSSVVVSGRDDFGGLAGRNTGTISKCYSSPVMSSSVFNNYLTFDGVDDYIAIPHNDAYIGTAFTLEAWFQWNGVGTNAIQFIIGKGFEQFEIHLGGDSGINGIRFIPIANVGGDSWIDARNVISPGWFHVAVVYEYNAGVPQATAKVYINGKLQSLWQKSINVGTEAVLPRVTNTLSTNKDELDIGRRSNGTYYFNGKICDVRYWNIARTAADIAADKDRQLTGGEPGLVGYWKLDEESGTTAEDSSSYHNDGALMNGITRGSTDAATNVGGLVGVNTGTVSDSFYDSQLSKQLDSGKGTAKITSEMKQSNTYIDAGWDMTGVWGRSDVINDGYPYLLSASKIITSFSFQALAPAVNGIIDETAGTIVLFVPGGMALTALTPTIAYMGTSVSPESGVAQDFTNPVVYTVTAADGSTKQYTVTVYNTTTEPVISTQPGNVTGDAGNQANFEVSAASTDGGALSYQWQKSMDGGTSWSDITGEINNTYTIASLSFNDDGNKYRCLVTNTTGSGFKTVPSDAAELTVTAANNSTVDISAWTGKTSLIIPAGYNVTVTGSYSNIKIICNAGVTLNLQDVNITNTSAPETGYSPITFTGMGNILNINGVNTLLAGISAPGINTAGAYITIRGTGSLTATGGNGGIGSSIAGAGIGSAVNTRSNITIESGTITATGGVCYRGVKVPNGEGICANNITISGGDITALGTHGGAGIGGGCTTSGSSVTILGGTVTANGKLGSVGIGCLGGSHLTDNIITISGGRVVAKGGTGNIGTGIGSRSLSTGGGSIRLTGGVIFASRNSTTNIADDIGNVDPSSWSVDISGTAAVFLQYDKSTVNTTTHVHDTFTETGDVYGIPLPAGWTAPFGAYLSHPQLSYDLNGGSGATPASVTQLAGTATVVTGTAISITETVTSPAGTAVKVTETAVSVSGSAVISRPGYNFKRWNTSADGKGITYGLGDTFVFGNNNVTLYAIWEKIVLPGDTTPGGTPGGTSPGGAPGGTAPSSDEAITVDIKQGDSEDTISQLTVSRSTEADGSKKDTVTLPKDDAVEIVSELIVNGEDTARIVIPDQEDAVSETRINLPSDSLEVLAEGDINLNIETEDAKIDLPKESLEKAMDTLEEDLYFNLVPVKEQEKRDEAVQHAVFEVGLISNTSEDLLSAIGDPVMIETNMPSSAADITLPLTGLEIPENPEQRAALLQQLAVYIEHSDGEKELVQGEIVNYKDGLYGIRFHITKFSIFTIVKSDAFAKSSECDVIKILVPSDAVINSDHITAAVQAQTDTITVKAEVSDKAHWSLYRDRECTSEIPGGKLTLKTGINTTYLKVTAEDGTSKIYLLEITRNKSTEAKITKITIPKGAVISKTNITAVAAYDTESIEIKVQVSKKATWKVYSDKACTHEVKDHKLKLKTGANRCYIRVTAENGTSKQVYTLTITREKAPSASDKCSVRLGAVSSKSYAYKLADIIKKNYDAENVVVKKEGKYYRIYMDFKDKAAAEAACKDMVKKKYITHYYYYKK